MGEKEIQQLIEDKCMLLFDFHLAEYNKEDTEEIIKKITKKGDKLVEFNKERDVKKYVDIKKYNELLELYLKKHRSLSLDERDFIKEISYEVFGKGNSINGTSTEKQERLKNRNR